MLTQKKWHNVFRQAAIGATALAGLGLCSPAQAASRLALMPMPVSVEQHEGNLRLNGTLETGISGCTDEMAASAAARFRTDLVRLTGEYPAPGKIALSITCRSHDANALALGAQESYRLSVTDSGITVEADGEAGVVRALATLRQLVSRDDKGAMMPAVAISDAPRFAWRGVMIDTARHFVKVETIKRQIDAMEQAKFNVLHLHLSDNEGFRVESRAFPRLTSVASHGEYYTQAEIRDLVHYAAVRGIRVVPEFDLPGHSNALLNAYPELGVAAIDPKDPMLKPKSVLNPASEKTYRFLTKFIAEMTALFPDRQFHVGGDEVSDVAWKDSAEIDAFKLKHGLKTKQDVEGWFHQRLRVMLASHGKSTIGWDEMADGPLPKDVIVQAWRSSNPLATATASGHRVIVSAGFYINDLRSADWHYAINMLDPNAYSTMSAEGLAKVRRNPVTAAQVSDGLAAHQVPALTPEQEKLIIGGEAPLWAETVTDEMLDGRIWPRGLAIAERFWSSASLTDPDDMFKRMLPAMDRLRALGLLDTVRRGGMISRLAPNEPDVVANLVEQSAPSRLFANHMMAMISGKPPELVELTDAASTDGSAARRFRVNVTSYLSGDVSLAPMLRATLSGWRDNHPAFVKVAAGGPLLAAAVPTSADLAALGELGLAALDAIENRKPLATERLTAGRELLAKLKNYDLASQTMDAITVMKQPPAALILLPAPDVARLVDAASKDAK